MIVGILIFTGLVIGLILGYCAAKDAQTAKTFTYEEVEKIVNERIGLFSDQITRLAKSAEANQ